MPIEWQPRAQQWHLHNGRLSVVLAVLESGQLGQLYLGAPLTPGRDYRHLARGPFPGYDNRLGDPIRFELPTPDSGDYRLPALAVRHADGSQVLDLQYAAHRILAGKPAIEGLPSTYTEDAAEADTLEIDLLDATSGLTATVRLTIFRDHGAIARSITVRNGGSTPARITTLMSASLDLLDGDWELISLHGAWSRERHVVRALLLPGRQVTESLRGSSSLEQSPFLALVRPSTTEAVGEVIGLSLVYSGDFLADAQSDLYSTV
ncbi:MAG: alpha-galactosidase, partial [Chloroflexi bacterium]|nr:alpha-galactosidase [Chloroflexota bacterium]